MKKILIVVESIYSMEGTICNFRKLIEIKKKYKVGRSNKSKGKEEKKILIVVEVVYSMEGTICDLRKLIEIKKKYKVRTISGKKKFDKFFFNFFFS